MGDGRREASTRVRAARIDSCLPGAQLHGAIMLPSRHVSDSSLVGLVDRRRYLCGVGATSPNKSHRSTTVSDTDHVQAAIHVHARQDTRHETCPLHRLAESRRPQIRNTEFGVQRACSMSRPSRKAGRGGGGGGGGSIGQHHGGTKQH
jgi:hypothetical protein